MKLSGGEIVVIIGSALIVAFAVTVGSIIYFKPPPVQFVYLESATAKRGEQIYRRESCLSCHEIFGNGGAYGPSLDGVGSKRDKEWLHRYVIAPWPKVSAKPYRLVMPPNDHLPAEDLRLLVEYLSALKVAEQ